MRYFPSAQAAAEALEAPLLVRADADARAVTLHPRLSGYAVSIAHAARFYHRLRDVVIREGLGPGIDGKAFWVAGPPGSLEHLPWAVGLADQAARIGLRAFLAERGEGPLRALIPSGGRLRSEGLPAAVGLLGGPLVSFSSDLEGVRLLVRARPEDRFEAGPPADRAPWCLILADGVPDDPAEPVPTAEGLAGAVLVAGYRDHAAEELLALAGRLRSAGHHLLGFAAIGPEGESSELEAPALVLPGAAALGRMAEMLKSEGRDEEVTPEPAATPVTSRSGDVQILAAAEKTAGVPEPPAAVGAPVAGETEPAPAVKAETCAEAEPLPAVESPAPNGGSAARSAQTPTPPALAKPSAPVESPGLARTPPLVSPKPSAPSGPPPRLTADGPPPRVPSELARSVPLRAALKTRATKERRVRRVFSALAATILVAAIVFVALLLFEPPRSARKPKSAHQPGAAAVAAAPDSARARRPAGRGFGSGGSQHGISAMPDSLAGQESPAEGSVPDSLALPGAPADSGALPESTISGVVNSAGGVPRHSWLPGDETGPGGPGETARDSIETVPGLPTESAEDFVIYIASFRMLSDTEMEIAALEKNGIAARYIRIPVPGQGTWYRIVFGHFGSFAEAESVALGFEAAGRIPTANIASAGGWGTPVPVNLPKRGP